MINSISGNTDFQTIMQTDQMGGSLGIIGSGIPSECYSQDFYRSNENSTLPLGTSISYPYPNPFNPSTSISFVLGLDSYVTIFIIDENEETIKTIVDSEWINAGPSSTTYQWNGTDNNGEYVDSGYYRVIIDFGDYECFANLHLYII